MTVPFATHHKAGIAFVDARADAAFREALLRSVPSSLRGKMQEALAATPDAAAMAHSIRYFGAELNSIKAQVAPLVEHLNLYLGRSLQLPGFLDWLNLTNFGNDYRMIKVFKGWSEMKLSEPTPRVIQ